MDDPLQLLAAEIRTELSGLSDQQTQIRPDKHPLRWSIQQIIEHLNLTYSTTAQVLRTRIEKGRPTQAAPSILQRAGQFWIIKLGRFPKGRGAPSAVTPPAVSHQLTGAELTLKAEELLAKLRDLAVAGVGMFGSQRAASHLVLGPLSIEQWKTFHLVHGRHHLKQIGLLRKANHV